MDVATPENAAIVSGIITIRNVSTRKCVLPNTGGPGVIMYNHVLLTGSNSITGCCGRIIL